MNGHGVSWISKTGPCLLRDPRAHRLSPCDPSRPVSRCSSGALASTRSGMPHAMPGTRQTRGAHLPTPSPSVMAGSVPRFTGRPSRSSSSTKTRYGAAHGRAVVTRPPRTLCRPSGSCCSLGASPALGSVPSATWRATRRRREPTTLP